MPASRSACTGSAEQRSHGAAVQQRRRNRGKHDSQHTAPEGEVDLVLAGDQLDADKIAEQQKKVDALRQQMVKSRVETHNQIAAVLTPEQRKQLRQYAPWWSGEAEE